VKIAINKSTDLNCYRLMQRRWRHRRNKTITLYWKKKHFGMTLDFLSEAVKLLFPMILLQTAICRQPIRTRIGPHEGHN
jgi:ABC-type bacteriocin/lantibiotic exporter with double-glycine peptidase domain